MELLLHCKAFFGGFTLAALKEIPESVLFIRAAWRALQAREQASWWLLGQLFLCRKRDLSSYEGVGVVECIYSAGRGSG